MHIISLFVEGTPVEGGEAQETYNRLEKLGNDFMDRERLSESITTLMALLGCW